MRLASDLQAPTMVAISSPPAFAFARAVAPPMRNKCGDAASSAYQAFLRCESRLFLASSYVTSRLLKRGVDSGQSDGSASIMSVIAAAVDREVR